MLIRKVANFITGFIHIQFPDHEIEKISMAEQRRIRMISYIGVITNLILLSYVAVYTLTDFELFKPAIVFLLISTLLTICVMIANKIGYHNTSKFIMALLNPLFMTSTAFIFFGNGTGFQTFLLLSAFIPLFLWPLSKPGYLVFFVVLNYSLYSIIEYFPPVINHIIELPENYINLFHSTNVLVCFLGAALAIAFYTVLATKKEESLVKKTQELEKSQRHQDLVYSIIAHDLRSPFNSLLGLSSILQQRYNYYDDEKKEKMIDGIFQSSKKINALLINLLDWSKHKSGMHKIDLQFISLRTIVSDTITLLEDMAKEKKVLLNNELDSNIKVFVDVYMVSTIFRNLIINAIKFTPYDGKVNISASKLDNKLRVCIEDNGIGIPQKYLNDLFDINSTFINIDTNLEKGSGLGLKICGDFIKASGGEIWAESEVNKGSRFYFTLHLDNYLL